jgi:site-specific recombinase XerD
MSARTKDAVPEKANKMARLQKPPLYGPRIPGLLGSVSLYQPKPDFPRLLEFKALIDRYCEWLLIGKYRSPETVYNFRRDLYLFLRYLQDVAKLDIRPSNVDKAMALEYQQWNVFRGTCQRRWTRLQIKLRAFFKWLHSEGLLPQNPVMTLSVPRNTKVPPRPIPIEHIQRLFSVFRTNDDLELRDLAFFEVMYGSGLRAGDAIALRNDSVVLADADLGPHLRYTGKGQKDSLAPLSLATAKVLKLFISRKASMKAGDGFFTGFGNAKYGLHSTATLASRFKIYLERAGLDHSYHPHMLRHSLATHLYDNGMPAEGIKAVLNHEHISSSMQYIEISVAKTMALYNKADIRATVEKYLRLQK